MLQDNLAKITLAHGAGGRETSEIIRRLFLSRFKIIRFGNGIGLPELEDGASIPIDKDRHIVLTVDSYTVNPIFFPGGDIGKLAATGTINDLAVMGATPIAALDSMVIEEGFPIEDLNRIIESLRTILENENIALIGGDFKVMPKGNIDKVVITMVGIGIVHTSNMLLDSNVKPGDKIIVTGSIGEHGATILALQSGMDVESSNLKSDCQPLTSIMKAVLGIGGVHAAKDPTRGGLAMALNEFAKKSNVGIMVWEDKIPIKEEVKMYSEMLGIDPLVLACEGRAVLSVSPDKAEDVLYALKKIGCSDAEIIGEALKEHQGMVILRTVAGGLRILEEPMGEIVPRIC